MGVKNVIKMVLGVEDLNDVVEEKRRMDICRDCVNLKGDRCGVCGCFMSIKTKLKYNYNLRGEIEETKCPIGKW